MQILDYHRANVQPVSAVYSLDEDVKFKHTKDFASSGLEFTFIDMLSSLQDTSLNSHTNLYLSEPKGVGNIIEVVPTKIEYPLYRSTYIKAKTSDSYWVVNGATGVLEVSGSAAYIDNRYFFELEMLDPSYLAVRHYDNSNLKYLTLNHTTSSQLTFETRIDDFKTYSRIEDTQLFQYIIDEDNNTLSLFSPILSGVIGSMDIVLPTQLTILQGVVQAGPVTISTTGSVDTNTFTIRPNTPAPSVLDLRNTWCSYVSAIEENTLSIDAVRSHTDINNNFLTSTAVNEISSTMKVNLLPLKNQLTIDGEISRTNPYASTENETTHRDYHEIHSGTYEEGGNDSIYLSYTSGVKKFTFPSTKLTYFHIPVIFAPYEQLNINESPLVQCGAIYGDSPIKSDKVFKNRSNSYNSKNLNDVNDGTWLCAWLSGSSDPASTPIWVDRYYNHKFTTSANALTAEARVSFLSSTYRGVISEISAQDTYIFDKRSDLVFEPEGLYAYHHIGQRDAEQYIGSLQSSLLIDSISTYKNYLDTDQHTTYEHDGPTHTMPNGSIMTGKGHDGTGVYVPETYTFDGSNYGTTTPIATEGSFTLNFWMYNSDWSTPFADQLIGNYVIDGFGIFNEPFVTPMIIIPDNNKIHIYNSQYKHIDVHNVNKNVGHITRRGSTENYWFVDISNTNNDIYEYDLKGVVRNKISSPHLSNKTIHDLEIDNDYLYAITGVEGNSARYFKYDLSNQNPSYRGESRAATIWNYQSSYTSAGSALRIHSMYSGLSGKTGGYYGTVNLEAPVIITAPDKNLSQGSVIDNYGYPWVIQDNYLYTYDASVSSNIIGVSAVGTQKLQAVNCDRDNNIWLLYGDNKVAKFNTNRNVSFTTTLSSTPYSSTRYIDFVHEFSDTGYISYATILNQSLSGCRAIAVNYDGTIKTGYAVLTGDDVNTDAIAHFTTPLSSYSWNSITGADFMRKHKLNNVPRLDAKLALTNLYNSSTTTAANSAYTVSYGISALKAGWHNIAVVLDAEKGLYDMYIDSVRVDRINITPSYFSYSNIFAQPLAVGASPFFTKLILADHLSQPKYYYTRNTKINRVKLYNKPLSYFDIRAHYMVNTNIRDMRWDMPAGERNYIDTVERTFKHRLPGRKSEMYNININGIGVTDDKIKNDIKTKIYDRLSQSAPMYTKLNNLIWDQSTTTTAATGTTSSVAKPAGDTNISQSTTSTSTGDTRTYGY